MVHLLFVATWLVRGPVGVHMRDILNSESDNQPENLCIHVNFCKMTVSGELFCVALPFCCAAVVLPCLSQHLLK